MLDRSATAPARDEFPGLKPPQFRLRTLLLAITAVAAFLAAARWTPPVVWGVGAFLALSVAAHIAGNALGTQLRRRNGAAFRGGEIAVTSSANRPPPTPPSSLHHREALGRPVLWFAVFGGIAGAVGGCGWLWMRYGAQLDAGALAIAGAGFGGLGAFLMFLACSFLQTVAHAVHQAHSPPPKH